MNNPVPVLHEQSDSISYASSRLMLIYKEEQLGASISSHTETLMRKQLGVGYTFCIFLRLYQVEAAE